MWILCLRARWFVGCVICVSVVSGVLLDCGLDVIWSVVVDVCFRVCYCLLFCCFVDLGGLVLITFVGVLCYGGFVNSVAISCL